MLSNVYDIVYWIKFILAFQLGFGKCYLKVSKYSIKCTNMCHNKMKYMQKMAYPINVQPLISNTSTFRCCYWDHIEDEYLFFHYVSASVPCLWI